MSLNKDVLSTKLFLILAAEDYMADKWEQVCSHVERPWRLIFSIMQTEKHAKCWETPQSLTACMHRWASLDQSNDMLHTKKGDRGADA